MVDYRIHAFLALYETMNYHRAAERLQISQPAVSQQIRGLENQYGCKLFCYDGRRLQRTDAADKLAEYARSALYNERQFRRELDRTDQKEVRLGATRTIGEYALGPALCRYVQHSSENLTVTVDNTAVLLDKLDLGELDFALVEGVFDKKRYGYRLYQKAEFTGMCHHTHPFANRTVSLEDLSGQSVVLREKGSGTRAIFEDVLEENGHSLSLFSRVICASSFSLIMRFVREGAGITFAYAAVAEGSPDIARFALDCLPAKREFNVVFLKGTRAEELACRVLDDFPYRPLGGEGD